MPTILKTKNSVTTTVVPTTLQQGELAVNITDKKMWVGNAATTPVQLFGAGADGSFVNLAYTGTLTGGTGIVNLGSNQFYKDANGQVGVGVIPNAWSTGKAVEVGGSGGALWGLASGTVYSTAGYYFNSTDKFAITGNYAMYSQLVSSDGSFRFVSSTATGTAGNNATMSERMRITSAGDVCVGTSTALFPNASRGNITINGSASSMINFVIGGSAKGYLIHDDSSFAVWNIDSSPLTFGTTDLERMRITSTGNVSIGKATNGGSRLEVVGTLKAENSANDSGLYFSNDGSVSTINASYGSTGAYTPIRFLTSDVERMRIDSSGNVGIGTTSPVSLLQVGSTATSDNALTVASANNTAAQINLLGDSSATVGMNVKYEGNGNFFAVSSNNAGSLTERMRINSSGELVVGSTSISGARVNISATAVGGRTLYLNKGTGDTTDFFIVADTTTANRFLVLGSGNVQNTNNSYGAISDIKLKENIVDATPKLEDLCKVKVRNYNLKGDYEQHKQIGVVAQELEQVFAGLVEETKDIDKDGNNLGTTTKAVKYSVFVPMLIKAVQELKAELDSVKAELQTLKGN